MITYRIKTTAYLLLHIILCSANNTYLYKDNIWVLLAFSSTFHQTDLILLVVSIMTDPSLLRAYLFPLSIFGICGVEDNFGLLFKTNLLELTDHPIYFARQLPRWLNGNYVSNCFVFFSKAIKL